MGKVDRRSLTSLGGGGEVPFYLLSAASGVNRYPTIQELYDASIGDGESPKIVYIDPTGTIVTNSNFSGGNFSGYQWIANDKSGRFTNPKGITIRQLSSGLVMNWEGFPSIIDGINVTFRSDIGPIYRHYGGLITEVRGNGIFRNYNPGFGGSGGFFTIAGDSHIILKDKASLFYDGFIFDDDTSILDIHCYDQSSITRANTSRINFNRVRIHIYSNDVVLDPLFIQYGLATIINHTGFNIEALPATIVPDSSTSSINAMTYNETTRVMTLTINSPLTALDYSRVTIDDMDTTEEGIMRIRYCPVLEYNAALLTVKLLIPENYTGPLTYISGGDVYPVPVTYLGTFENMLSAHYSMQNTGADDAYPCLSFRDLETGDIYQPQSITIGGATPYNHQTGILTINNTANEVVSDVYSIGVPLSIGTDTGINKVEALIDLSQISGPAVSLTFKSLKLK